MPLSPGCIQAEDVRRDASLPSAGCCPRVHVVDGAMFVTDEGSATCLLSEHRILAAPIGVR